MLTSGSQSENWSNLLIDLVKVFVWRAEFQTARIYSNLLYNNFAKAIDISLIILLPCCFFILITLRLQSIKNFFFLGGEEAGDINKLLSMTLKFYIRFRIETSIPQPKDIELVILDAIPIAIVIYSVSISLSRLLSEKHGYEINSNQVNHLVFYSFRFFKVNFIHFVSGTSCLRSCKCFWCIFSMLSKRIFYVSFDHLGWNWWKYTGEKKRFIFRK